MKWQTNFKKHWNTWAASAISGCGFLCYGLTFVVDDPAWSGGPSLFAWGMGWLWYVAIACQIMAFMVYRLELPTRRA